MIHFRVGLTVESWPSGFLVGTASPFLKAMLWGEAEAASGRLLFALLPGQALVGGFSGQCPELQTGDGHLHFPMFLRPCTCVVYVSFVVQWMLKGKRETFHHPGREIISLKLHSNLAKLVVELFHR